MGPCVCISGDLLLFSQVPVLTEGAANNGGSFAGADPQVLVATTEGATNDANNEGKLAAAGPSVVQSPNPDVAASRPQPRRYSGILRALYGAVIPAGGRDNQLLSRY